MSSKLMGEPTIQKLLNFKKFALKPFKEAKSPNEAHEWLQELEGVLKTLKTDEEEWMIFMENGKEKKKE